MNQDRIDEINRFRGILGHKPDDIVSIQALDGTQQYGPRHHKYVRTTAEIIEFIEKYENGLQIYFMLNPVKPDSDLTTWPTENHIQYTHNIYLDIDCDKTDDVITDPKKLKYYAATEEEYKAVWPIADKVKAWLNDWSFGAGYCDKTGNGIRFILPIPPFDVSDEIIRKEFKNKILTFYEEIEKDLNIKLDSVQDIRRITGIPGTLNRKLETETRKNRMREPGEVTERTEDKALLNHILSLKPKQKGAKGKGKAKPATGKTPDIGNTTKVHYSAVLNDLIKTDSEFLRLYSGDLKEDETDRSDLEMIVVNKLIKKGYNHNKNSLNFDEINTIMNKCKIGKWADDTEHYRKQTYNSALDFCEEPETHTTEAQTAIKAEIEPGVFLVSDVHNHYWKSSIIKDGRVVGQEVTSKFPLWVADEKRDRGLRQSLEVIEIGKKTTRRNILLKAINEIPDTVRRELMNKPEPEEPEDFEYISGIGWQQIKEHIENYMLIDDWAPIATTLATALTTKMPGDPVWLLSIAPPGAGKSEIIRGYTPNGRPNKYVHPISSITPNTFISGLPENEDLLPRLDSKIVTIKDFTTILTKQKDARNEILGQLREIYDGYYAIETGSGVGTRGYNSKFTLIAGCTPYIDNFGGLQSLLGERFVRIRDHGKGGENDTHRDKITKKAYEGEGIEDTMRQDIANNILSMYKDFNPDTLPEIPEDMAEIIMSCAAIIAVLRTGVHRDHYHNITSIPEPEYPTRIVKQLKKLAYGLAFVFGKSTVDNEIIEYIYRVSLDTVEKRRVEILKNVGVEEYKTSQIAKKVNLPTNTVKEVLEDLAALKVCKRTQKKSDDPDKSNDKMPYLWSLNVNSDLIKNVHCVETKLNLVDTHIRTGVHYNIYSNIIDNVICDIHGCSILRINEYEDNYEGLIKRLEDELGEDYDHTPFGKIVNAMNQHEELKKDLGPYRIGTDNEIKAFLSSTYGAPYQQHKAVMPLIVEIRNNGEVPA